ncbi:MAG: hypothetical protein H6737_24260 [Alphaproteobacteria bacterium]|nr:hypothetical protein [Alphaproteobacteria bacterium]
MAQVMAFTLEETEEIQKPAPAKRNGALYLLAAAVFGTGMLGVIGVLAVVATVLIGLLGSMLLLSVEPDPGPVFVEPVAAAVEPSSVAVAPPPVAAAAGLDLAVKVTGRKTFELVNLSKQDYTNVTVVLNGEYQYHLKKLVGNAGDSMRYGNFVSRRTGAAPSGKEAIHSVFVKSDQGSWSTRL